MKPSTYQPISEEKLTSTGTTDTQTATVPNGTSGLYVTVETTNCRMSLSPTGDPQTKGLILQKDQQPLFFPVGQGAQPRFVSTGASSVIQLQYI